MEINSEKAVTPEVVTGPSQNGTEELIKQVLNKNKSITTSQQNSSEASQEHPRIKINAEANPPAKEQQEAVSRKVDSIMEKAGSNDKVALTMGIIGVGNAGNQQAYAASKEGFPAVLINSSRKDLSDEITSSEIPAIIVGDGRGAGKDQKTGFQFLKNNLTNVFNNEAFAEIVEKSDILVVCASTAGGTGSGMSPLICDRLVNIFPNKIIIPCLTLPKKCESIQSHMNTVAYFKQFEKSQSLKNLSYLAFTLETYKDDPDDVAYSKLISKIVNALKVIRGDYTKMSPNGMIDERDLLTTLAEPGYMVIASVDKLSYNDRNKSIQQKLVDEIKYGPTVQIEKDGRCGLVAAISDLPDELLDDPIRTGDMSELYSYIGEARDNFTNKSTTTSSTGSCHVICSGLSLPYNYLEDESSIVEEYVDRNSKRRNYTLDIDTKILQKAKADVQNKITGSKQEKNTVGVEDEVPDFFD